MGEKIIYLHDLDVELSILESKLIGASINRWGGSDHPVATIDIVRSFSVRYVLECLEKGQEKSRVEFWETFQGLMEKIADAAN